MVVKVMVMVVVKCDGGDEVWWWWWWFQNLFLQFDSTKKTDDIMFYLPLNVPIVPHPFQLSWRGLWFPWQLNFSSFLAALAALYLPLLVRQSVSTILNCDITSSTTDQIYLTYLPDLLPWPTWPTKLPDAPTPRHKDSFILPTYVPDLPSCCCCFVVVVLSELQKVIFKLLLNHF